MLQRARNVIALAPPRPQSVVRWLAALMSRTAFKATFVAGIVALTMGLSAPYLAKQFVDFGAFYCAGQVQLSGSDSYREHPLSECERALPAPGILHDGVTMPAPFPGFVLALFSGLALLPFPLARIIWEGAGCIAIGLAVALVARTTRTSVMANTIVLGFPAVILSLQEGQPTPLVLLAVASCAVMLHTGRPRLAALAALGAMMDPHVGLALVLGIVVAVREARRALFAGAATLLLLDICVSGPAREWEYVRFVIPAHALANMSDATQFSTTNFAFVAGAPGALALTVGSLWYVGALVVGILVAVRLRAQLGIAAVAYIPPAFAVFGGTHTHMQQLALAIPAFMLLSATATSWRRELCSVATFVAAIPWIFVAPFPALFIVPPALAVLFTREMKAGRQGLRLGAASLAMIALIVLFIVHSHPAHALFHADVPGNPLAEVPWQLFTISKYVPTEPWYLVAKAPTVIAFCVLFGVFVKAALRRGAVVR